MTDTAYEKQDLMYKILVVGDIGTGKTSLIKKYVHNIFSPHYKSTVGVDFALKVIDWDNNLTIRLQLWDIAGQERFANLTRSYYKEAVGALVVFDVTRQTTFEGVNKWKTDLDSKICSTDTEENIPVILLANKVDLFQDEDKKYWEEMKGKIQKYCDEQGFIGWVETSAKNGVGIETAVKQLITTILDKKTDDVEVNPMYESIILDNPQNVQPYKTYSDRCC
jgi:Ras-related protein Rab-32